MFFLLLGNRCIPCSKKVLKFKAALKAAGKMVKNVNADDFSYTADGEGVEGVVATINDDGVLTGAKELGDVCDTTYVFLYWNDKSLWDKNSK